jgi:hypothetical protein
MSLTFADLMELELERVFWLLERLGEERAREASAIKKASSRGSGP